MIDVSIPAEFEPFVQHAVQSGEFRSPDEVVAEGLRLLRNREALREAVRAGVDQLDAGQYTQYSEADLPRFLEDIEAEQTTRGRQGATNR